MIITRMITDNNRKIIVMIMILTKILMIVIIKKNNDNDMNKIFIYDIDNGNNEDKMTIMKITMRMIIY